MYHAMKRGPIVDLRSTIRVYVLWEEMSKQNNNLILKAYPMKDFLTSFPSSTPSNRIGEPSISNRQTQKISKGFIAITLLVASFFLASTNNSFSQSHDGIGTLTVPAELVVSEWKSPVDYTAVITNMKASTATILENPNLQTAERALYTGFDRMLSYIQVDLESHADLTKIAETNYHKVVKEAPSDPILINMQMNEFAALYDILVNKLRP